MDLDRSRSGFHRSFGVRKKRLFSLEKKRKLVIIANETINSLPKIFSMQLEKLKDAFSPVLFPIPLILLQNIHGCFDTVGGGTDDSPGITAALAGDVKVFHGFGPAAPVAYGLDG